MTIFDFNVAIGRYARPGLGCFDTPAELSLALDAQGISEALVFHALAAEGDMVAGNKLLTELLASHSRLHACWVVAPSYAGDLPEADRWIEVAREAHVRAVRIFPRYHLYSIDEHCMGPLAAVLARAHMPLIIDFAARHWSEQVIPWVSIVTLAKQHPNLNIVIAGTTVGDVRDMFAVLRSVPNVHFDTSTLIMPETHAQLANAGHASRLLFGTGLPRRAPECALQQLLCSNLPKAELNAIAAGNAFGLLKAPSAMHRASADWTSPKFSGPVIDVHAHCGSWERTTTPLKTPSAFLLSMDRCNIDKMVFSSFSAIHGETSRGNTEAATWAAQYPERLFAYCVVNPNFPTETRADLPRCFEERQNFVGLKLHCQLHGAQLHDAGYAHALEYANEHRLPVLVHGGGEDRWDDVCAQYPDANFIMAHACAWDGVDPTLRHLYARVAHTPNLYVDTSGSPAHRGAMRALVDLVGIDKVLYGSDFPMFDLAFESGRVVRSDLSDAEKASICSENALRIFRRMNA